MSSTPKHPKKPSFQSTQFSLDKSVFSIGNWLHDKFSAGSNKDWQRPECDDNLLSLRAFPLPRRYLWTPIIDFQLFFHLVTSKPPHRKHLPKLEKAVGSFSWCYGTVWTEKEIQDILINFWAFSSLVCLALCPRSWKNSPSLSYVICNSAAAASSKNSMATFILEAFIRDVWKSARKWVTEWTHPSASYCS